MLTNRTSALTLAAIATLALAASDADASPFCHRGGFASFSRAYIPVVPQQRIVSVRPKIEEKVAKAANKYRPEPVVSKVVRAQPKDIETAVAKPANSYQPAQLAGAATVVPISTPATAATTTCLTKEYLDTGAVLFKDVCTQEWAMNSTSVSNKLSAVGRSCLIKDNAQDGVIMFKDVCTQEWAMNTVEHAVAR